MGHATKRSAILAKRLGINDSRKKVDDDDECNYQMVDHWYPFTFILSDCARRSYLFLTAFLYENLALIVFITLDYGALLAPRLRADSAALRHSESRLRIA
jgi:hypothetical protein